MTQHDLRFDPYVLIVPVGAEVSFPNLDTVRHHVYSFSPTKTFQLKLYAKGEAPAVKMDKAGVVAVGCNIHDAMSGFVVVSDTPFFAKTGADGVAVVHGLPAGAATLVVWHPYQKTKDNRLSSPVNIAPAGASQAVKLDLRAPPHAMQMD